MSAGSTLSTTNQLLTISTDAVQLSGAVTTGTALLNYAPNSQYSIGIGIGTEQVEWASAELAAIVTAGMTLGSAGVNKNLVISGIKLIHSAGMQGTTTLIATSDDALVRFDGSGSTFAGLSAQADNGIEVAVDLTSTTGILYLNADFDKNKFFYKVDCKRA